MLTVLKDAKIYTPDYVGIKDILFDEGKILAIEAELTISGVEHNIIDAKGLSVMPGLIDNHVHFLGGGGEAGPHSRVPEIMIEDFIDAGITTAFGLIGTDGFSRSMHNLVAKAKGLRREGFNAYVLSGSYQVPQRTLLNTIQEDMMFIEEIIGSGEIAISDHRSSAPTVSELSKIVSDTHVGGLLSNKAGVVNVHVGSGKAGLKPLKDVLAQSDVSPKAILPTHINRSETLLKEGIHYAKTYDAPIDFTAYLGKNDSLSAEKVVQRAISEGVNIKNITVSSDGQGSLPEFDDEGNFVRMGIGSVASLFHCFKACVKRHQMPIEKALRPFSTNVATLFKLKQKGKLEVGFDADILVVDEAFNLRHVFLNGKHALNNGNHQIKGTFSK